MRKPSFLSYGGVAAALLTATARGESGWAAAYTKAQAALPKLSLEEKAGIVSGKGWDVHGPCVGNASPASSINYPPLCLQDGPLGVRYSESSTAFTPGVQAASTWDIELIRQRGQYLAEEARGLGVNVMLGPACGPLGKVPQGGRNWEGFSPDPYLTGIAIAETVKAMQGAGVQATAKHYILNEQEKNRDYLSSNVDDRTTHELYLWPFADAVHADVAAVMCSYNKINGTWACENEHVMNTLLKEELGFKGYVMTDWAAQHTTVESAEAGLDMTMPGSNYNGGDVFWGPTLVKAVRNGQVSESRVDDMVTRVLAAWYLTGQDADYPPVDLRKDVQSNHGENVMAIARDGIVLLKNDNGALPLDKPSSIAVVGSAAVKGKHANNGCDDKGCNDGALGMGWGSGAVDYPYFVAPYDAIKKRAGAEGAQVALSKSDDTNQAKSVAAGKDVALVFITADAGEGYITVEGTEGDRNNLDPWHGGNQLVEAVASVNDNVVVVVHSVGALILEDILKHPSVKAIVWAGLPSQESGNALTEVLWGDVSPSGKLVYTIAKSAGDYGTQVVQGDDEFQEGLFIDYRHFDERDIEPRYEFGFGLSYTNFTYADVSVQSTVRSGPATGPIAPGGHSDLFEEVATASVAITNTGDVDGAEVAQLYVAYPSAAPETPPRQLRGFAKLHLRAGETGTAAFSLRRRDLSFWDVTLQNWVVPTGQFVVSVGASSRDVRTKRTLQVS